MQKYCLFSRVYIYFLILENSLPKRPAQAGPMTGRHAGLGLLWSSPFELEIPSKYLTGLVKNARLDLPICSRPQMPLCDAGS